MSELRRLVTEAREDAVAEQFRDALDRWLAFYNRDRRHTALGGLSPERWLRARGVTRVSAEFT